MGKALQLSHNRVLKPLVEWRLIPAGTALLGLKAHRPPQNYTSIDPKQQQTMFSRRSCTIKNSLGAPFLRKETKEKKGDNPEKGKKIKEGNKPRNPSWNKTEGGNHDGTQCHRTTETSPTTFPGTR